MKATKKQVEKFKKVSRELGCDDDKARFEKKLGKIAKAKAGPRSGAKDDRRGQQ